jgi:hypothetical protein
MRSRKVFFLFCQPRHRFDGHFPAAATFENDALSNLGLQRLIDLPLSYISRRIYQNCQMKIFDFWTKRLQRSTDRKKSFRPNEQPELEETIAEA